jgi:uncharacterized RDD family membrane protein YckC
VIKAPFQVWFFAFLLAVGTLHSQDAVAPEQQPKTDAVPETREPDEPKTEVVTHDTLDDWQQNQRRQRTTRKTLVRRHSRDIVQVRGDVVVKEGEVVGDIVVVAGTLKMDGEVEGSIVSVASETEINGRVSRNVVIVPGPVKFGPKTDIREDAIVVGEGKADPEAKFGRGLHPVPVPELVGVIGGAKDFVFQGLLMMRPLPPHVRWVWFAHGGMLLALLGLMLLFPKPVRYGAAAIADRPVMSMFSGFLTVILFLPVLVLISVTIVGLPVGILGIVLAAFFGKAALMTFLGQQIGRNLNLSFLQSPVVAFVVGALVLMGLYMVPVVGLFVWGVATLLGIGAIMVATASALNNRPSVPTPVGPAPAVGAAPPIVEPVITSEVAIAASTPAVLKRVGFWKRTLASILDLLLLLFPMILSGGFAPLVAIGYFVLMWTWRGTTIGMICLGLKIVRIDGSPIDFAVALVRSLAACFSFVVLFLGFFWAGWDREKQSWHDKIAGTIVVQVPKGVSLL